MYGTQAQVYDFMYIRASLVPCLNSRATCALKDGQYKTHSYAYIYACVRVRVHAISYIGLNVWVGQDVLLLTAFVFCPLCHLFVN